MNLTEITQLHSKFVRPGFGTTKPDELMFIQSVIQKYKPRKIIEIGTASGLTTGFIARFLDETDGASITSVDILQQFFGDRRYKAGFLADQIYTGQTIKVEIKRGMSSLDLGPSDGPWDMAFIDANPDYSSRRGCVMAAVA